MSYRELYRSGELDKRIEKFYKTLESCSLCPRKCGVNRLNDEKGYCRAGKFPRVSSFVPHFGEEPPLVGRFGSGTIFFTNCNLSCQFCQNYEISQLGMGEEISTYELADEMLSLQGSRCHNINLVTPTHFVPQIISALKIAIANGLTLPLVYNCGGYESVETLYLLYGIIDIYMPDAKYEVEKEAKKYSNAPCYPQIMKEALKEMHRQVGDLKIDESGIAQRGLLVRHLVLPHNLAGTAEVIRFIAEDISKDTYVNIMDQYRPCYRAPDFPLLSRRITREEHASAIELAASLGLRVSS
jgi:putative pyruvate formate lyase activating enzyme